MSHIGTPCVLASRAFSRVIHRGHFSDRPLTIAEALGHAAGYLGDRGVDTPRLDAELLLGKALGLTRIQLYSETGRPLSADDLARFHELVARRGRREPLQYVLGEWGFRRLTLKVDGRALIPRPETEIVVDRCLTLLAGIPEPRVLDLGAGSGAIALAIADEHPGARVTAVDVSTAALALARENAERAGLEVELRQGGVGAVKGDWDLVVSNPPYVAPADLDRLQPEIRDWEPHGALAGAGLHEVIARELRSGWLVLEVGDGQAPGIAATLGELGYADLRVTRDLAGRERVVEGRR